MWRPIWQLVAPHSFKTREIILEFQFVHMKSILFYFIFKYFFYFISFRFSFPLFFFLFPSIICFRPLASLQFLRQHFSMWNSPNLKLWILSLFPKASKSTSLKPERSLILDSIWLRFKQVKKFIHANASKISTWSWYKLLITLAKYFCQLSKFHNTSQKEDKYSCIT